MESNVRNIRRFWYSKEYDTVFFPWNDDDYDKYDCKSRIFETRWCYYCPICQFVPVLFEDRDSALQYAKEHSGAFHKNTTGSVVKRDIELSCFETKEVFKEDFNMWISMIQFY